MPDKPRNPSPVKAIIAAKRLRDANGHFIKKGLLSIEENKNQKDETLIDVKVTNPLHRITMILQDIKRRQATTIDLKFTIPLIALPVFMLIAFSLGKNASVLAACQGNTQTKIGVIYILKSIPATPQGLSAKISGFFSFLPFFDKTNTNQIQTVNRPILIQRDNSTMTLNNQSNVNLTPYQTRQVFATGIFNSCENTLTLQSADDVQLVP